MSSTGLYSDYTGLSEGSKIAIGLIFGLFLPCGLIAVCCWYCRRNKAPGSSSGQSAYTSSSPRRRHARLDEDEHRGHTLHLDDPPMEFSVQGSDATNGKGSRASRSFGDEDGLEEVKLDGDDDAYSLPQKKKKKKSGKKSGKAKKRRTTDEDEDVDELELGGI